MCGIVGVIGSIGLLERRVFQQLLKVGVLRGDDSTGVFSDDKRGQCWYHKETDTPCHFVLDVPTVSVIDKASSFLIGHNRAATAGAINAENAHPFAFGNITLVHNGTLDTTYNLRSKHAVDSAQICEELATEPDTVAVLEKLDGAFALVWHDTVKRTINIARNDDRPLAMATVGLGAATRYYIASERMMLDWILDRCKVSSTIGNVKSGRWLSRSLDGGDWVSTEFTPAESYYSGWYGGGNRGNGYKNTYANSMGTKYLDNDNWLHARGLSKGQKVTFTPHSYQPIGSGGTAGWALGVVKEASTSTAARLFISAADFEMNKPLAVTVADKGTHKGAFVIQVSAVPIHGLPAPEVEILKGLRVTRKQYEEDVAQGCCGCGKDFSAADKKTGIEWYGESMPVHKQCFGDAV